MKTLIIILFLLIVSSEILICQPQKRIREKAVKEELNNYFQNNYSGMYEIGDIIDINSLRGNLKYFFDSIQNPYGMLTNCFVFSTKFRIEPEGKDVGNRVGIYKDGNIVWLSDPDIYEFTSGLIITVDDINMDNSVEIITEWGAVVSSLYIHSWDGVGGRAIIGDDQYIFGRSFALSFVDVEGDGIIEIRDLNAEDGSIVWSWNGSEYGQWPNTPSAPDKKLYPANNFIPHVKCLVKKENETNVYDYIVENDPQSKQRIELFWVVAEVNKKNLVKKFPRYWKSSGYSNNLEGWDRPVLNNGFLIWPGEKKGGFKFITNGLPAISTFAMQAYNVPPPAYGLSNSETRAFGEKNRTENMVWGKTIGPREPSDTLNREAFLDTLISFSNQSIDLGWIQNQATRDKYNAYFNNAKTYLEQNNNNAAKSELQIVLSECNADSSSVLTSEAYALLYFNTEYLIEQLPDSEPGLPVKLQDSQGNLLPGGSLKYYNAGWKDAIDNGNGTFIVQTERTKVSLKMTYAGGSQQLKKVTVGPDTAIFQTVNVKVQLQDSQGNLLPGGPSGAGLVKYYAGGWKDFGEAINGEATKELLPKNYRFRMTYEGASLNKKQDIGTNNIVSFSTVSCVVRVVDSSNQPIDNALASYTASGWKEIGNTVNGEISKELLPKNYNFRVNSNNVNQNKQQDIENNNIVEFVLE